MDRHWEIGPHPYVPVGKLFKGWVGDTAGLLWEGSSKAIRQIPQAGGPLCQASESVDRALGPHLENMTCWPHGLSSGIALVEGVWCTRQCPESFL